MRRLKLLAAERRKKPSSQPAVNGGLSGLAASPAAEPVSLGILPFGPLSGTFNSMGGGGAIPASGGWADPLPASATMAVTASQACQSDRMRARSASSIQSLSS